MRATSRCVTSRAACTSRVAPPRARRLRLPTTRARASRDDSVADDDDRAGIDDDDLGFSDALLERAVAEARELLEMACAMADEQARRELLRAFRAPSADADDDVDRERTVASVAADMLRVQLFLRDKGLKDFEAERVSKELARADAIYQDAGRLAVKFDRVEKALAIPGMDVARLVSNAPELVITMDLQRASNNLMHLASVFKIEKIAVMLLDCPKLLTCDDLEERLRRTREYIQRIWSSETHEDTTYAISEEPNLVFTLADLEIFQAGTAVDISELPMSVQGANVCARAPRVFCRRARRYVFSLVRVSVCCVAVRFLF